MKRNARLSTIGLIYDVVLTQADYHPLLDAVMDWTGADQVSLWRYDEKLDTSLGISAERLQRRKLTTHEIASAGAAFPAQALSRAEGDMITLQSVVAEKGHSRLFLHITQQLRKPLKQENITDAFADLVQVMRHAFALKNTTTSSHFATYGLQILDSIRLGIAIYDSKFEVISGANAAGKICLEKYGIHSPQSEDFGLSHSVLTPAIAEVMAQVLKRPAAPVVMDLPDGSHSLLTFSLGKSNASLSSGIALVFLPSAQSTSLLGFVAQKYLLTPREQCICNALLAGQKLPDIAQELGLGHETVRSHAKAIFGKCGVHGHAEFLAKLLIGIDVFDWDNLGAAPVTAW